MNTRSTKNTKRALQAMGLILILSLLIVEKGGEKASAQPGEAGPVADVRIESTKIVWQPQGAYARLVLSIGEPDGKVVTKTFEGSEAPSFEVVDANGARRADGHYTYELRAEPVLDAETKAVLAAAAESEQRAQVVEELRQAGKLPIQPPVQSGSFSISSGSFVQGGTEEGSNTRLGQSDAPISPKDILQGDDVIVQGSLCAGFDCFVGESFGDTTIRLKENNTRIEFMDTSTTPGYASNSWMIEANSLAGGGLNYLAFRDIDGNRLPFLVEAGARNNALYLKQTGRLGLGTANPAQDLHILTGNTPAIRLDQDSTSGFSSQVWDIAGNEANFFVRDVTHSSKRPFVIRPGAPTSSIEIAASGNVGIGTASPAEKLHVTGNVKVDGYVDVAGNVKVDGYVIEYSDVNAKQNFSPVDGAEILRQLSKMPVQTWSYRADDPSIRHMGPTAQDFYAAYGLGADDRHIAALDTNGVALAAIQELAKDGNEQDARITDLEKENAELKARIAELERMVNALAASRQGS